MKNKKNPKLNKKIIAEAFFEIFTMILSTIAFAFMVGGMALGASVAAVPEVEAAESASTAGAAELIPKGCCIEAKDGSSCVNMANVDAKACKKDLVATDCSLVEKCQPGCCYDSDSGMCSFNSPKEKCEKGGGNWSKKANCEIAQCNLGCCVLGNQASITTSRQCTKLSGELDFGKNFQALDSDGTCESKINLDDEGACVTESDDFSGEKTCKFTTKKECKSGDFYKDYLCTSKELNTICKPSKNTTCLPNADQIYYVDSCGNRANIFDAKKYSSADYWNKVIAPEESCQNPGANCGNCNYLAGSRCYLYRTGKDTKAAMGNYVCRDLNCLNGRKHGESWCISDYTNTGDAGVAPVGSRWFRGICLDGEITIEPCADFNQEICVETKDEGFNEASCFTNNWRTCSAANSKSTYAEVAAECAKHDQCKMFLDISNSGTAGKGNSGYEGLAGFKRNVNNGYQASAGSIGTSANSGIPWCVPKYTPGTVFWTSSDNTKNTNYGLDYGGSSSETDAICAVGSFTCITKYKKDNALQTWNVDEEDNPECWYYENSAKAIGWFEGLNERCRMLGPCGAKPNIVGELGSNTVNGSSVIKTMRVDSSGKSVYEWTENFKLSDSYKSSLKSKAKMITPGSLTSLTAAVISVITGKATTSSSSNASTEFSSAVTEAKAKKYDAPMAWTSSSLSAIGAATAGILLAGKIGTASVGATVGSAAVGALAGAVAGYMLGQLIAKIFKMSNAETYALSWSFAAGGALGGLTTELVTSGAFTTAAPVASASQLTTVTSSGLEMFSTFNAVQESSLLATAPISEGGGAVVGGSTGGAAGGGAGAAKAGEAVAATSFCTPCLVIAIAVIIVVIIVTYIFTYKDHKYYITSYQCKKWEPPLNGDCSVCNKDVRTCSEYRCRSLGENCHYYNDEGEPGYCAGVYDIWSAKIEPWKEMLTPGNKYTQIQSKSFKIEANNKEEVEGWDNLEFGIKTDKLAKCKLDIKHTKSIDEMKFDFIPDPALGCVSGSCGNLGYYHRITLSPHIDANISDAQTPSLLEGDNNYYIRCKNYAGQVNDAEFAVKIKRDSGPDLTPPNVLAFLPQTNSYVKVGENSTSVILLVNEPSECRFSQNVNSFYENMENTMSCITSPAAGIAGKWACSATLANLSVGENKFYFACEDKPDAKDDPTIRRNINHNSKEYVVNLCSTGLMIRDLQPRNTIISGTSPISAKLTAETGGCINGGKSVCYYQFSDGAEIAFLNSDSTTHSQPFDNLEKGEHNINVRCEDAAGNTANSSLKITVFVDDTAPNITRSYDENKKLVITTDEDAVCKYTNNETIGCDFDFQSNVNITTMAGSAKMHTADWSDYLEYYIKCADSYGNTNSQCGMIISTY